MLQKIGFQPGINKQVTPTGAEGQWIDCDNVRFRYGTGADNVLDERRNIIKPNAPEGTKVMLEVGDMLVYSGCDLEHWREPFEGNICGQVFLHYNHVNGPFADKNKFDGRPMLGLPSFVK